MAKKIKRVATTIKDRAELEQVMGKYAAQVLERDRLTVEMEERILSIRAQYESDIAECVEVGDGLFEDMQAWAALNRNEFGERKSIELMHGTLGFRTCPPSVKLMKGVRTQDALDRIHDAGPSDGSWIRIKEEVNKEAILAAVAAGEFDANRLPSYGLFLEQGELFFTDVKREDGKEVK